MPYDYIQKYFSVNFKHICLCLLVTGIMNQKNGKRWTPGCFYLSLQEVEVEKLGHRDIISLAFKLL